MIVDDAVTARMMIASILRELGFDFIYEAENGKQALEKISELPPLELIFVDWNMPQLNGLELVQEIRKNPAYDQTKIMMVTTETSMNKVVEALEAGASEYIMKPFNKEILTDKLKIIGVNAPAWL